MNNIIIQKNEPLNVKSFREKDATYLDGEITQNREDKIIMFTKWLLYYKNIYDERKSKKNEKTSDILSMVGSNIRVIRKVKGLTISELASKSNLSSKYLQGVETGKRNISVTNLNNIANVLQMPLNVFFSIDSKKAEKLFKVIDKLENYSSNQITYIEKAIDNLNKTIDKKIDDKS